MYNTQLYKRFHLLQFQQNKSHFQPQFQPQQPRIQKNNIPSQQSKVQQNRFNLNQNFNNLNRFNLILNGTTQGCGCGK